MLSPHDSLSSSALGLPCFPVAPFVESLPSAQESPAPAAQPAPGSCPLEMAAAWECGWGPPGAALPPPPPPLLDRGLSVELPGSFHGPRPMTGRLRMPPIIRLTEHKGATRGLGRPGARDGCTGALGPHPSLLRPHHRGQGCAQSRERASVTHRNENHFLQPLGETKTETSRGSAHHRQGRAPLPSPDTKPRRAPPLPTLPPRDIQWGRGGNTPELGRGVTPVVFHRVCSGEIPAEPRQQHQWSVIETRV